MGDIHVTTRRPKAPEGADFAIEIQFKRGEGSPYRVFRAADMMIRALQKVDRALCASIDTSIEPLMVLEDVEAGSLRIWLKHALLSTDDQALKDMDWKPALGKYLVRAKYAYIQWANKADKDRTLLDLAKSIRGIASETDVKKFPDYAPPPIGALAESVGEIEQAKAELVEGDKISYIPKDESPVDFDLTVKWAPEELSAMLIKETTKFENMPMNLIVKKPDYLGTSRWDLRHGRKIITAKIEDAVWLEQFQSRQIDVRPGDALRCLATVEHHYGYDNELVKEDFAITKVESVLENQVAQGGLFDEEEE